jgi:hypothetical protein
LRRIHKRTSNKRRLKKLEALGLDDIKMVRRPKIEGANYRYQNKRRFSPKLVANKMTKQETPDRGASYKISK